MVLSATAHVDTFAADHLPPREQWPTLEFTIPEVQYPARLNAATELITDGVARFGADRPCLRTPDGEVWTYGDLLHRANQVAQVLTEDLGVVPGNRVLLRGPNTPWIVAAWLGSLKAGAVVVTTMHALRARELAPVVERTKPTVALVDHRFAGDVLAVADSTLSVVSYGAEDSGDLTSRCATKSGEFTDVVTAADDVALLCPTSGTTGVPKITMHFHRDILANADTFARFMVQPREDDVFAGSAPFAFTFGLGGSVVFPLRFGASSLLVERATPVELVELCPDNGVTVLFTVPTAYRAILREGRSHLLAGIRVAISAGEHLPQSVWQEVYEGTGLRLIEGIGSTELLHVFISAAGDDIRPGFTGKAIPGFRATILDENGEEAPVGELGRLAVIGPTGCRYLDDARQANYVCNGWNVTGDTFRMDEDGYFHYEARSDDMIVSSGYNIGAPEVEGALGQHHDVVESAVIGKPDAARGTLVAAYVVLRDGIVGDDHKRKELQDFVKQTIAPYKYPREVTFVDSLPRNPSGKLQHFRLREQLKEQYSYVGKDN
ncbi:AMP-binding protein [Klugiella xanthotipulae]|uniref:2-aminobenzoate-CoA ligase n=1 Tax=Klugiella xanthotipulae TaxID=244735 RepID=A0A543I713_9MICO|nr:AMP-binding protein [Klugiella xanthotipulae]TQM66393.1 2-aminobenzoate-CoA ligase [Klugiella xanthotipulae]